MKSLTRKEGNQLRKKSQQKIKEMKRKIKVTKIKEFTHQTKGVQAVITGGYWLKPLTANRLAIIVFHQPPPLTALER
jgi:hypothetical protein